MYPWLSAALSNGAHEMKPRRLISSFFDLSPLPLDVFEWVSPIPHPCCLYRPSTLINQIQEPFAVAPAKLSPGSSISSFWGLTSLFSLHKSIRHPHCLRTAFVHPYMIPYIRSCPLAIRYGSVLGGSKPAPSRARSSPDNWIACSHLPMPFTLTRTHPPAGKRPSLWS
jgi:hypothetical protein